jgi:hypothetical protein
LSPCRTACDSELNPFPLFARIDRRTALEQELHHLGLPAIARKDQRRHTLPVNRIDRGTTVEQQRNRLQVPPRSGPMQRRLAILA